MKITIVGAGYVGLTSAACLAKIGHQVVCVDKDTTKISTLKMGGMPIYEPGLQTIIEETTQSGNLIFDNNINKAVSDSEVCFIAVGTPPFETGEPDLTGVEEVAREIANTMSDYLLIVEKSTVPVQTGKWIRKTNRTL